MIELTPLERFQLKWTARRERLLRAIRRKKQLALRAQIKFVRRHLAEDIAGDFAALKDAQRFSPRNEQLRKMAENPLPSASTYAGDESWD
jgi:hypothetical protein